MPLRSFVSFTHLTLPTKRVVLYVCVLVLRGKKETDEMVSQV